MLLPDNVLKIQSDITGFVFELWKDKTYH